MSTTAPPVTPRHIARFMQADYDVRRVMKEMHGINWPTAAEYGERDHGRASWSKDTYEFLTRRLEALLFVVELHTVQPEDRKWVQEAYFYVFRIGGAFNSVLARLHRRMLMYRLIDLYTNTNAATSIKIGRMIWEDGSTP